LNRLQNLATASGHFVARREIGSGSEDFTGSDFINWMNGWKEP
jgi:hypothetical protein